MRSRLAGCADCQGRGEVVTIILRPCCSGWMCGCMGQPWPDEAMTLCPYNCPLPGEPTNPLEAVADHFRW
jgi:hypothetical protein